MVHYSAQRPNTADRAVQTFVLDIDGEISCGSLLVSDLGDVPSLHALISWDRRA